MAPHHVYSLYKKYKGSKSLAIVEGGHNGVRPEYVQQDILKFIKFIFNSKKNEKLVLATIENVFKSKSRGKTNYDIRFGHTSRHQTRSGNKS